MDTNDKNGLLVRIAVGSALAAIGGALMSRLPQLLPGQTGIPWYEDRYLITGAAIAFVGLLVLTVSPARWKRLWVLLRESPLRAVREYRWKRYGPAYTVSKPSLQYEAIEVGGRYTATFEVLVRNRDSYPMLVDLTKGSLRVEQRVGRHTRWIDLIVQGEHCRPYCNILPRGQERYQIVMTRDHGGHSADFPNLGERYRWTLRCIRVELEGAGSRLLCSKKGWTNAEKKNSR